MNLFVISDDPVVCAQMLDNRRVVKMTTETAQMLSDAIRVRDGNPFYSKCNPNHPCTKWVTANRSNFEWAISLLEALNNEYRFRYQKDHDHGAFAKAFQTCKAQIELFPVEDRTPFQNSSMFKEEHNVFLAYKKTMVHKWTEFKLSPRWTNRSKPSWTE